MKDYAIVFARLITSSILIGALGTGIAFAALMVVCTGGAALVIVIPIALVALPLSFKILKYLRGNMKTSTFGLSLIMIGGTVWAAAVAADESYGCSRYGRDCELVTIMSILAVAAFILWLFTIRNLVNQYRTQPKLAARNVFVGRMSNALAHTKSYIHEHTSTDQNVTTQEQGTNYNTLIDYVRNARNYGATDEVIETNLRTAGGWSDEEISDAFMLAKEE